MTGNEAHAVNNLLRLASAQESDSLLLDRFLTTADANAFAELVRRHGPMVLGVCRRVLGNWADADDAFQAAFLVLARKGGSVRNGRSVASWLFGAARFTALRARDKARRRREHETNAGREHHPEAQVDSELLAVLDEELHRLPNEYRATLVACFLQGRTQEEAARETGCSLSTLRRRLERGQELLRRRLVSRGVAPALGTIGASAGAANLSAAMVESTTALAVAFGHGKAGAVPATTLAEGVIAMMGQTKLKMLVAAVLVAVAFAGSAVAWQLTAAQPPKPLPDMVPPGAKAPAKPDEPAKPPEPPAKDKSDPVKGADTKPVEDRIKPGDRLVVHIMGGFDQERIDVPLEVEASGKILLGPAYGRVKIDGLTLEEAEQVTVKHLQKILKEPGVAIRRYSPPEGRELELRVRNLELEVKQLGLLVEELRKRKQ